MCEKKCVSVFLKVWVFEYALLEYPSKIQCKDETCERCKYVFTNYFNVVQKGNILNTNILFSEKLLDNEPQSITLLFIQNYS